MLLPSTSQYFVTNSRASRYHSLKIREGISGFPVIQRCAMFWFSTRAAHAKRGPVKKAIPIQPILHNPDSNFSNKLRNVRKRERRLVLRLQKYFQSTNNEAKEKLILRLLAWAKYHNTLNQSLGFASIPIIQENQGFFDYYLPSNEAYRCQLFFNEYDSTRSLGFKALKIYIR